VHIFICLTWLISIVLGVDFVMHHSFSI
jgi:hypothetical protein